MRFSLLLFLMGCLGVLGCDTEDANTNDTGADVPASGTWVDYFAEGRAVSSPTVVDCTLQDGTSTQCYEMVFRGTPDAMGPFCPTTLDDVGGVGIYDGATNPGFQVMKRELFEAMEADGYDIVDDNGNIRVADGTGGMPDPNFAYCLALPADDALELVFRIPVTPVDLTAPHTLETVELFGVALDGLPLTGDPPSVVDGPPIPNARGGNIP